MIPIVKICGLTTVDAVMAAEHADYVGFIFYPPSPRHLSPAKAAQLAHDAPFKTVAVTVNAEDALLNEIKTQLKPSYFQLHGDETPARVREVKIRFGIPVIKAITVATAQDVIKASTYDEADMLLFDARPPKGLPGGNGVAFDWNLLNHLHRFHQPWFLSGGLGLGNIEEAMRITGAKMLDVSSGLESSSGIKDPVRVGEFIKKVKSLSV